MFDMGFQEIVLIGVIALIVIGPERLPSVARSIGSVSYTHLTLPTKA